MGSSVVIASFFPLNFFQFIRHHVEFGIDFSVIPDIVLQTSLRIGNPLLNFVELSHHSVEIIID